MSPVFCAPSSRASLVRTKVPHVLHIAPLRNINFVHMVAVVINLGWGCCGGGGGGLGRVCGGNRGLGGGGSDGIVVVFVVVVILVAVILAILVGVVDVEVVIVVQAAVRLIPTLFWQLL